MVLAFTVKVEFKPTQRRLSLSSAKLEAHSAPARRFCYNSCWSSQAVQLDACLTATKSQPTLPWRGTVLMAYEVSVLVCLTPLYAWVYLHVLPQPGRATEANYTRCTLRSQSARQDDDHDVDSCGPGAIPDIWQPGSRYRLFRDLIQIGWNYSKHVAYDCIGAQYTGEICKSPCMNGGNP